jgi:hypothetical protein
VDERFITLDDPELGTRTYHEQHFFCAECGDPFLPPSSSASGNRSFAGDGAFEDADVGFTVYKGHPYCENCHVRLRMPKCKKCKKSIRDGARAVEALGGKWCWGCFVCTVRSTPRLRSRSVLMLSLCRAARGRSTTPRSSRGTNSRSANTVSALLSGTRSRFFLSVLPSRSPCF